MIYHNLWESIIDDIGNMDDQVFLSILGKRIAQVRKEKGFSQLDLGTEIDMEKSNLSAIENGRQNPSTLTLKRIADALDVKVVDFFKH